MQENIDIKRASEAMTTLLPALIVIVGEFLKSIVISGAQAVTLSRVYKRLLDKDDALLRKTFKEISEDLDEIELRAYAYWATEQRLESITNLDGQTLYKEGRELKNKAVQVLKFVDGSNKEVQKVIHVTNPGTGYLDCANDLTAIEPHIEQRRADIIERKLMTAEEIDRMSELAPILLDFAGGKKSQNKEAAKLLKKQAWTHFYNAYKEVRRHIEYIHFHNPEALKEYPTLKGK